MTKRVVLFSMISALLLAGCGKSSPADVARPVALGGNSAPIAQPIAPEMEAPAPVYEEYPADGTYPAEWDAEEEEATPEVAASTAEEIAEAEAAAEAEAERLAEEEAERLAEEEAEREAEEAERAAEEAAEEAERAAAEAKLKAPHTHALVIGNGSLHTAQGFAIDNGQIFVLDNQRTGLLGKYAAVRVYDLASGDYLKRSIENIGWAGAKNMPATVNRIKIEGGQLFAADDTTTYVFSLTDDKLVEKREGTFANVTEVTNPKNDDVYKLNGNTIERIHDGEVKVAFGDDELTQATAIAVDAEGTLYVSDASGKVHVFTHPAD